MENLLNPAVFPVLVIFGLPIIATLAYFAYKAYEIHSRNELKQSMIDRGMSVDEIERVLNAGEKKKSD